MKQLANKPLLLGLIFTFPLWIVSGDIVVALCVGLLVSFLIAMLHSLRVLKRNPPGDDSVGGSSDQEGQR